MSGPLLGVIFNSFLVLQVLAGGNNSRTLEYCHEITDLQWKGSPSKLLTSASKYDINNMLENFSLSIKPTNEFYLKGRKIAKQIYKVLKRSHYDVDRYVIAGSAGKGTALNGSSDFDVVVFINDIEPPLLQVIHELQQIVNDNSYKFEHYKYRGTTEMLIKIKASKIRFDIIPTANYKKVNLTNYKETFLKIQKLSNPFVYYCPYNGGLSEESAAFGRKQSTFVHSVVRLAKYWNEKINITEFSHGRSFRMELIAIKACEGVPENNFYLAFKKFLNMMADFEHLYIIFEDYYKTSEIPPFLLQYRGPILLNPVNYYANMVHHWSISESAVLQYKTNAKISLRELEKWKVNPCADSKSFENIFSKDYSSEYQINFKTDCKASEYYTIN